jgi:hypothetical protein
VKARAHTVKKESILLLGPLSIDKKKENEKGPHSTPIGAIGRSIGNTIVLIHCNSTLLNKRCQKLHTDTIKERSAVSCA